MKLSIVTTLYHSESYVYEVYERITNSAKQITEDYEIIFVNDGSPDNSLDIAISIHDADSKVTVLDLSRNFGHHKAIKAGLSITKGEYVYLIDSDLEEAPELLLPFWEELQNSVDVDVVYGVQKKRKGSFFEKIYGRLYYLILNNLLSMNYPADTLTSRIMTRRYIDSIMKYKEREYDLWCNFVIAGFNQISIEVEKSYKGSTQYNFIKKVSLAIETITSSSERPLIVIFLLGFLILMFSVVYIIYLIINYCIFNISEGWTSLIASIWFLGGIIISCVGVIGIYLSKVFIETKDRPDFIIKKKY